MNAPAMPPPKAPPPKSPAPARAATAIPALALPTRRAIVPRVLFMGVEGWGKTSLAAHADGAVILMAKGETGYQTLVDSGRAPLVPTALIESWDALLGVLDALIANPGETKLLALDALGGFERLLHERVCERDFAGVWGEKGFASFHKGYDLAVTDWLGLLNRLDRLNEKGVAILMLSHVQVRNFKNPAGSDFDRYEAAAHPKTVAVTNKWADACLFGQFLTITDKQGGRTKGIGGTDRIIYCERRDSFDAKNRFGLPESIDVPADHTKAWSILSSLITKV